MDTSTPGWPALGQVAYARRQRLGLSHRAVTDRGGPGVSTQRTIEQHQGDETNRSITARTLGKLDYALAWPPGTADCLVRGNDPNAMQRWDDFVSISITDITDHTNDTIAARLGRNQITTVSQEVEQLNTYLLYSDYHLSSLKNIATAEQLEYINAIERGIRDSRYVVLGWLLAAREDN